MAVIAALSFQVTIYVISTVPVRCTTPSPVCTVAKFSKQVFFAPATITVKHPYTTVVMSGLRRSVFGRPRTASAVTEDFSLGPVSSVASTVEQATDPYPRPKRGPLYMGMVISKTAGLVLYFPLFRRFFYFYGSSIEFQGFRSQSMVVCQVSATYYGFCVICRLSRSVRLCNGGYLYFFYLFGDFRERQPRYSQASRTRFGTFFSYSLGHLSTSSKASSVYCRGGFYVLGLGTFMSLFSLFRLYVFVKGMDFVV